MIVIKNCPFCNWHDVEIDEIAIGQYAVCCPDRCAKPSVSTDVNEIIKRWNQRFDHRTILDPQVTL